ncbi:MAG TPA: hypothetical protein VI670_17895 [Thermoanaerobaculia bacterium]
MTKESAAATRGLRFMARVYSRKTGIRDTPIDMAQQNDTRWFARLWHWLAVHTTDLVEWFGTALVIALLFWAWTSPPVKFIPHTWFGVLATLPGVLGLVNHFSTVLPRFQTVRETVRDYQAFCRGFDVWWLEEGWPRKLREAGYAKLVSAPERMIEVRNGSPYDNDLRSYRPSAAIAIWAAVILTLVFEIPAGVANGRGTTWPLAGFPLELDPNVLSGFLFASLGAFVAVMWRMINRINANALSARFMFTAALRAAIAMLIGLIAGKVNLFELKDESTLQGTLFFLIGLFTDWGLSALRARARTVFNQPNDPCDRLPLCFVDGLDDGVIDILDELGIWDVQHLATSEPGELTAKTLYPFNRIIDWIDQAILISYFRRDISEARKVGITGAIDLATLYSYTLEKTEPESKITTKANAILDELSKKMGMSREAIELICSNLYFDYTVEQLYRFWQHHRRDQTPSNATATTPAPAAP